jgi:hypothetical protein
MSTAPNLRMLFNTYHNGFDNFGRWSDHHKAMHAKHPLGCAEFGAARLKLWEALGKLLNSSAQLEFYDATTGRWWVPSYGGQAPQTVQECLIMAQFADRRRKVVLAWDGTIVKEWGAT